MESCAFSVGELPIAAREDEFALVERAKTEPAAMAELYRQHYAAIAGYVRRRIRDPHHSEDVIAEVFLAMVRYLPAYRNRGVPFRSWLYRLATTQISRWARRRRRWAKRQLDEIGEPADSATLENRPRLDSELVSLVLLSLPSRFQEVLHLYYVEDLSLAEIAQVLSKPMGTVKSRLSRGRKLMRVRLSAKGYLND
ncbi:MAG: RNA polymerase sigma factor [Pirellulales bacterium]